ncbi:hypothetical protein [Calothrix sp. UHCC 0171]|uniref:hypothetical protein n=1 Tax=Calothrix sp. UHCC 0171 TaxID=3110245 RepID=UPI002B1F75E2|nr:hypothetical protein [Calothrix sp. UHCC 0171]MEA5570067.1 hypothetical protein [Calothrix sp. UHCC 0171]
MKINKQLLLAAIAVITTISIWIADNCLQPALSLPPADDIPEEILRTEIITAARSPIDGKKLTAAEYIELQAQLREVPPPKLDSGIRERIFLLQIRKALLQLFPFLNF